LRARIRARKNQTKQAEKTLKIGTRNESQPLKKELINLSKFKFSIADLIDEASRLGNFVRIYPCEGCEIYDKFFTPQRNSNRALLAFIMNQENAQDEKMMSGVDFQGDKDLEKEKEKSKLIITGDDILIEYLSRVLHACKSVTSEKLRSEWKNALDKFVSHYIWVSISSAVSANLSLLQRLELRIGEMKERRRQAEMSLKEVSSYQSQKHAIVRGFSALQLENMLKSSSKSLAKEVMSCLFFDNSGILSEIIKWLANSSIKKSKKGKSVMRNGSLTVEDFERNKGNKV
jgi:hypothetical protein